MFPQSSGLLQQSTGPVFFPKLSALPASLQSSCAGARNRGRSPRVKAELSFEELPPNALRRKIDPQWKGGFSIGVDLGLARTGLALSKGFSVRPLTVLELRGQKLELRLLEIAEDEEADEFVIGLPKSCDGKETPQSNKVRSVAGRFAVRAAERGWRVYLQDEYGTSGEASDLMISMGLSKSTRQTKMDAYAAVMVLERYFSSSVTASCLPNTKTSSFFPSLKRLNPRQARSSSNSPSSANNPKSFSLPPSMAQGFMFEPPSDEEVELSDQEEQEEDQEGGEEYEEVEDDKHPNRPKQSPWDFAAYSESVADEHSRRSTTSVDEKISKALQRHSVSINNRSNDSHNTSNDASSDSESDRQEDYRPEEDEDGVCNADESSKSFFAPSEGASFHANSFMELNLSRPLLRACEALGYAKPTPIQAACIPLALTGRDICGSAITGSGKTAAFSLPTLERLLFRPKRIPAIRVLILTPTRELAVQVHSMIEKLAQFTDIRCCLVVGGLSTKVQEAALRSMPDIVVATPGRMIDHLRNSMSIDLDDLAVLILDEADRLLELGFNAEIHELVRLCPKRRQTMLFSATMTEEVDELVKLSLTKPLRLSADPSAKRPATLTEEVVRVRRMREVNQEAVLFALCSKTFTSKVIIFSGTKQTAHRLKILFGLAGFKAAELHGNLTQAQRLEALELFRKQHVDFLIATDVAARGLDIIGVQTVINYACPRDLTSYVHRVGRTARAGREGYAVTFVTDNDRSLLKSIAKRAGSKLKSRIVAEQSIAKWSQIIEQMDSQVAAVLQEEREERALRKAEMEVTKAENMIAHKDEIFSRPKRTWFVSEKEKKAAAKAGKASLDKGKAVVSAQEAEDKKLKEKRKREREKNFPRKKRRKLQAAREMLEEEDEIKKSEVSGKSNKEKTGMSLVDLGYRRAKAAKAVKKALDAGKLVRKSSKKTKNSSQRNQSRSEEMQQLFQSDMSERKQKRSDGAGNRKSKNSFKSKSRYKRR